MNIVLRGSKKILVAIAIPCILFFLSMLLVPERIGFNVLPNLLQQAIIPAILALGVCFEIKVGVWDFSIGANVMVSGIIGGNLAMMFNLGIPGLIIMCTLIGLAIGTITGALYTVLRVPSLIVSIGMMLVLESISAIIFNGDGANLSKEYLVIGEFPINVIVGILAFVLAYYFYNFRKFGYQLRAVGNGIGEAKLNGINVFFVRILAFSTAGLFAGIYAFMTLGSSGVVRIVTNMGSMGVVFGAIMCVLIAFAIGKSVNLIVGIMIGSITVQIIKIGILTIGLPSAFQQVIIVILLLIFLAINTKIVDFKDMMRRFRRKKELKQASIASHDGIEY